MRRVLVWTGGVLLGLLLLAGGLLWWGLATEAGARFLFARFGALMKGSVTASRIEGTIRSPLVAHGLVYRTETMTVTVRRAEVRWRLAELLRRRLDILSLRADGVTIRMTSAAAEKERERLPDVHLPVNVIVRGAAVRDIRIERPGSKGRPLRFDSIELATSAIGDLLRVDRLSVRSPEIRGDLSGTVRPRGDYPIDLTLAWSAAFPEAPAYRGRGTFGGSLERMLVRHTLEAPFAAEVSAVLTTPLRDLRFAGDATFPRIRTRDFRSDAPEAQIAGTVHAEGSVEVFSVRGRLDALVAANRLGRVAAAFEAEKREETWRISRLDLRFPGIPTSLSAAGTVRLPAGGPRFDLDLRWRRIAWPLRGPAITSSPAGKARVSGGLEDYVVRLEAEIAGRGLPRGRWRLDARGDRNALVIRSFTGALLSGTITGSGRFAWKPDAAWEIDARGSDLNPAGAWPQYPGQLGFHVRSRGRMAPAGPSGTVELEEMSGTLRREPLRGTALVELDGERIRIRQASVELASARVSASGEIGRSWSLSWLARADDLGLVVEGAGGSLAASGQVTGPRRAPRVRASLQAKGLSHGGRSVAELGIEADVDFESSSESFLDLTATGLLPGKGRREIETLTVTGRGRPRSHRVELAAVSGDQKLDLALAGGVERQVWTGELARLDFDPGEAEPWRLASSAPLSVSRETAGLRGFCWTSRSARLCGEASWKREGPSNVQAVLSDLPLEIFKPWFPEGAEVTGPVNGKIEAVAAKDGTLTADVRVDPGPGELRYVSDGDRVAVPYRNASIRFRAEPAGGAAGTLSVELVGVGGISASVELPRFNAKGLPLKAQPVSGKVSADLRDVGFAQAFVSSTRRIAGAAKADLAFSGTAADPRVTGEASLRGVRADLPDYGLELRDGSFSARSDGSGPIHLDGSVRSGQGTLKMAGQTPLKPTAADPLALTITGRRFQALGTRDRRVWISPDLKITATDRRVSVTGDLGVPEGSIEYRRRFATIPVSRDVVFVGEAAREVSPRAAGTREILAQVRLVLGDRIRVKGLGFDGRLTGTVLAFERPGRPATATGELEIVEGTYKAYGQDLTIERGRILFAGGPIDDPGLDLKAFRKADDGVVAGVLVRGTLKSPELTLYSDPPMAQSEALAYLLLGHPLGEASPQEGSLVANAAASLGVAGGNLLGKQLAARFGLEKAKIETEGSFEEASLVVGKYLSPRLYVEYGIGLFDQTSTIAIEYVLGRKWRIRAETGNENSADVLYTFER